MTANYTPGPWKTNGNAIEAIDSTDPEWSILLGSVEDIDGEYGSWKDNVRLIAAAPDLLSVAQEIVDFVLDDNYSLKNDKKFNIELEQIYKHARTAIDKAIKGEPSK